MGRFGEDWGISEVDRHKLQEKEMKRAGKLGSEEARKLKDEKA